MIIGIEKLVQDLKDLGYDTVTKINAGGADFAIIPNFEIPGGSFSDRSIDLGVPATPDYPRTGPSSIHVKANPPLFPLGSVPGVRNIQASGLGAEWQYWSFRFILSPVNPTTELLSKINEIFRKF